MSTQIPDIPSQSIFGHLREYVRDPLSFLQKHQKLYGDFFTFRVANRQLIFINHPDCIQRVLQDNHRNYKKSEAYRKLALLLGDGLFTSDGEYWRSQRRIIQPAFHRDQIKTYAEVMHEFSMKMIDRWKGEKEIGFTGEMTRVTLQIITKTMLNVDLEKHAAIVEQHLPFALKYMVNRITSPLTAPIWIPTRKNQKFKATVEILDELIREIIQFKKEHLDIDLLSQLISLENEETGTGMTDSQLRDEVMTIFLAGHETTAMALVWIFNYILRNHEIKSRLVNEIGRIRNPWEGIENYYVHHIINESLRLFTPVWILSRVANDHDYLGECEIKKGDRIIFSPYLVHRHPDFWENPDQFIPERFDEAPSHRYAYFPFGGGPRVCIGQHFALMEITILMINMLRHFPGMKLKSIEPVGYDYSITLRPDREIVVTL